MRDWLGPDHPVWMVIRIVERLDTSEFHRGRRVGGVGRAGYDPDMLVTLLIWAWLQGVRSSRRIERACADVVPYRVICAGEGPDHVTISRFRADNHNACAQLFTQVLVLAAQLGLGRLETVALDGVKIASNASLAANRTASGLQRAAEAQAARIAEQAVNAHAAADAVEDAMFGDANPATVPVELVDLQVLTERIDAAKARLGDIDPDDVEPDGSDDPPPPAVMSGPSTKSVDPGPVPHGRAARIAAAQDSIDAEVADQRAKRQAVVDGYMARIGAGEKMAGRVPVEAVVVVAERQLAAAIAAVQAKHTSWASRGPAGQRRAGRRPVPVDRNARVRQAKERLERARASADAAPPAVEASTQDTDRYANITDPQSRIQPLRGGGWVQGYNCQAVTTADGLILATGVGTSSVDSRYYLAMVDKAVVAADVITAHRTVASDQSPAREIGLVLADAGYCTQNNLTAPGPDRLIATGKARDLHNAAVDAPADGPPPQGSDPIAAMRHRLRTPDGITSYAKRSHIAETPFGHAKHNLGFRRFTSRGLARARTEWAFHAAVHNIGKIINHLAGTPQPA